MTMYRRIWTAVLAVLTALGTTAALALADLTTVIAGALLCGFMTGLVTASSVWASAKSRRRDTVGTATAVAAIGWAALLGLVELTGPGALAVVVLLAGAGLPLIVHARRQRGGSDAELRARLSSLTLTELCADWRAGALEPLSTTDPRRRARLVEVRGMYLDEFERRDPSGFADWLHHDALRSDPAAYLGRGRGAAA